MPKVYTDAIKCLPMADIINFDQHRKEKDTELNQELEAFDNMVSQLEIYGNLSPKQKMLIKKKKESLIAGLDRIDEHLTLIYRDVWDI